MTDDATNLEIRKFLKQFGVAAQRAIEDAARTAGGGKTLHLKATLSINQQADAHIEHGEVRLG